MTICNAFHLKPCQIVIRKTSYYLTQRDVKKLLIAAFGHSTYREKQMKYAAFNAKVAYFTV